MGWGCFSIGDNGGNIIGVCVFVSLLVLCPNIGMVVVGGYMLLRDLMCLSPDVVDMIGDECGEGVGSIAGVAHCEC